jgi:hypothetical protein
MDNQLKHRLTGINNLPSTITETGSLISKLLSPPGKSFLTDIEKKINFSMCLSSNNTEPSLLTAARIDENAVLKVIYLQAYNFIQTNFPDTETATVAETVARDLLEINPTWTILDVVYLFKWIRHNQSRKDIKVLGNKINSLNILSMAAVYNSERVAEHERKLSEDQQREKEILNNLVSEDNRTVKEKAAALADLNHLAETGQISPEERRKRYGRLLRDKPSTDGINKNLIGLGEMLAEKIRITEAGQRAAEIEKAERNRKYFRENEFCINWLRDNKVPENIGAIWFYLFSRRKY